MQLNNNLKNYPQWITDSTGKITGYKTLGGADTVFPFSSGLEIVSAGKWGGGKNYTETYTADKDATYIIFMCCSSAVGDATYTLRVTSATADVNKIVADTKYRGARAIYTVNLKRGENIDAYFNTSAASSYTCAIFIARC